MRSGIVICFALLALTCSQVATAQESLVITPSAYAGAHEGSSGRPGRRVSTACREILGSCQAGAKRHGSQLKGTVGQAVRKASVVACEYPPKSHVNVNGLSSAATAASLANG